MNTEERIITISTTTILRTVAVLLILVFLWFVRDIVVVVFIAFILAALMLPFTKWMRKFHVPSTVSVLIFYLILFGGLTTIFILLIPQLVRQLGDLGALIGTSWNAAADGVSTVKSFVAQYGLEQNFELGMTSAQAYSGKLVGGVFSTISGLFGGIAAFILVLVLAYYMVVEERNAVQWFKNIIPDKYQEYASNLLFEVERKYSRWLVGQLSLCVIIGICDFIGLSILGIDGALILSLFGGFVEFIPYVGPILSGIVIALVALTQSPILAALSVILILIIQELENHILVPKIMQKAVGLNPVISIVALLVGAKLFGFVGVLLSIPVATAVSVVLMEYFKFVNDQKSDATKR
jgi:predicted PurR-regulated permease PerM